MRPTHNWIQQTFETIPAVEYRVAYRANGFNYSEAFAGLRFQVFDGAGALLFDKQFPAGGTDGAVWDDGKIFYFTAVSAQTKLRITHLGNSLIQLDDIQIAPRAPKSAISLYPAIRIEGFANTPYRVEYSDSNAPTNWLRLNGILINSDPPVILDTNAPPTNAARLYRIVEDSLLNE
jgi:hypothetical protein